MSTITVSNINDGTTSVPSNCVTNGSGKAWINFNSATTTTIRSSFNTSSLTDNGTGNHTISLSNAFSAADYGATGLPGGSSGLPTAGQSAPRELGIYTTTQIQTANFYPGSNAATDHGVCFYVLIGDLA